MSSFPLKGLLKFIVYTLGYFAMIGAMTGTVALFLVLFGNFDADQEKATYNAVLDYASPTTLNQETLQCATKSQPREENDFSSVKALRRSGTSNPKSSNRRTAAVTAFRAASRTRRLPT
jgi:hypothetical protein